MKIYFDQWNGVLDNGNSVDVHEFAEVEKLIDRLDQHTYTQISMNGENSYLLVGGGNGRYIVCITIGADEILYTLINPEANETNEEIDVVTGGQCGSFPPKIVVNNLLAKKACRYYFENENNDPSLLWMEE